MWEEKMARLFCILSFLSPHSQVTVEDLAREHELSKRTIERDIEILSRAKLGVFYDEEGYLKISRHGYQRIKSWVMA
jgi:predicted DNA-binding transcriptional regulator YafY